MSNPLIIIVGLPGSGKSFAGSVIKKRFNAFVLETGDIIREEIKKRGLKYNTKSDARIRHYFHPGKEHIIVKRILRKLKKSRKKVRVVIGFRCWKEVRLLEKHYRGKIVIIAIVSSFKIRAHREMKRKRFGKSETIKYMIKRDKDEKRIGLGTLIKKADFTINNSKLSKRQTEAKLIKLVKQILKQI